MEPIFVVFGQEKFIYINCCDPSAVPSLVLCAYVECSPLTRGVCPFVQLCAGGVCFAFVLVWVVIVCPGDRRPADNGHFCGRSIQARVGRVFASVIEYDESIHAQQRVEFDPFADVFGLVFNHGAECNLSSWTLCWWRCLCGCLESYLHQADQSVLVWKVFKGGCSCYWAEQIILHGSQS